MLPPQYVNVSSPYFALLIPATTCIPNLAKRTCCLGMAAAKRHWKVPELLQMIATLESALEVINSATGAGKAVRSPRQMHCAGENGVVKRLLLRTCRVTLVCHIRTTTPHILPPGTMYFSSELPSVPLLSGGVLKRGCPS